MFNLFSRAQNPMKPAAHCNIRILFSLGESRMFPNFWSRAPGSRMGMAALLLAVLLMTGARSVSGEERIPLKILYAGKLDDRRTGEYRAFLEGYFQKVGVASYVTLKEAETEPYDVVILDWPELPPQKPETREPIVPPISQAYTRPTVLVGAGPLFLIRELQLKLRDFCVCLGDAAHGIRADHPIFTRPYPVKIELEERPTPIHYKYGRRGHAPGQTISVWQVQKEGWTLGASPDSGAIPGMVTWP